MDLTDRHCRRFHRQLTRHARLYTEMVTARAILHGNANRLLRFDPIEHPLALQLGGNNPRLLAHAAKIGEAYGYDEINLNCGCPSDKVVGGRFGACLMDEPKLVSDIVAAIKAVVTIPVTVKCRIGIDHSDDISFLHRFVEQVATAGCQTFIIHARKAWLSGLSPKQNREVPPLRYDVVNQLKRLNPQLQLVLNGGLGTLSDCTASLTTLDGVMLGRAVYEDPWLLANVDSSLFGARDPVQLREEVIEQIRPYIAAELAAGTSLARVTRHLLGLYRGQAGGRTFRRILSTQVHRADAGIEVLDLAMAEACRVARKAA